MCRFRYWNGWKNGTPASYGCCGPTREEFQERFPQRHLELLAEMPWYEAIDNYVFVHAGLSEYVAVEAQLDFLRQKDLSKVESLGYGTYRPGSGMPDQLAHKGWERTNCPAWGRIIVTGHNKYRERADFVASNRLGLHSCACERTMNPRLPLHCALLRRGARDLTMQGDAPQQFRVY